MHSSPDVSIISFLRCELEKRCEKNPQYSLRAFARGIGMAPSTLSMVLRGQRALSEKMLLQALQRLGLSDTERLQLLALHREEKANRRQQSRKTMTEMQMNGLSGNPA